MKFETLRDAMDDLREYKIFDKRLSARTVSVAVKAIMKQLPKKVLYEDVGYDFRKNENLYACICPSCKCRIIDFSDGDISYYDGFDGNFEKMFHSSMVHHAYDGLNGYCNRCGQKLDWGD